MAKVIVTKNLENLINKKFKGESVKVFELIYSLKNNPKKGKYIGKVGGIIIKEFKYKSFRLYFITEGYKLKLIDNYELTNLLIKFVRMSNKKDQQKVIEEIKIILKEFGKEDF